MYWPSDVHKWSPGMGRKHFIKILEKGTRTSGMSVFKYADQDSFYECSGVIEYFEGRVIGVVALLHHVTPPQRIEYTYIAVKMAAAELIKLVASSKRNTAFVALMEVLVGVPHTDCETLHDALKAIGSPEAANISHMAIGGAPVKKQSKRIPKGQLSFDF